MARALDRLTLLRTFVRVVELGSLTAAARDLGVSQPSVTRQIADLESRMGVTLLHRTTHAVTVSAAGASALMDARAMLAQWDRFEERHASGDGPLAGPVKIIAPVGLGQTQLADAVAGFLKAYPGVAVTWQLEDGPVNLVAEGADLWIKVGPVPDDRLVQREVVTLERQFVCTPEAPRTRFIALDGFALPKQAPGGEDTMEVVFRTNNFVAAYRQVLAGVGVAMLPNWFVAKDVETGRLVQPWPAPGTAALPLTIAYLPGARPARVTKVLEWLAESLKALAVNPVDDRD